MHASMKNCDSRPISRLVQMTNANRKAYAMYWVVQFPMTLNDSPVHTQISTARHYSTVDVEYLRNGTRWRRSYNAVPVGTYAVLSGVNSNDLEWPQQSSELHGGRTALFDNWASFEVKQRQRSVELVLNWPNVKLQGIRTTLCVPVHNLRT